MWGSKLVQPEVPKLIDVGKCNVLVAYADRYNAIDTVRIPFVGELRRFSVYEDCFADTALYKAQAFINKTQPFCLPNTSTYIPRDRVYRYVICDEESYCVYTA